MIHILFQLLIFVDVEEHEGYIYGHAIFGLLCI